MQIAVLRILQKMVCPKIILFLGFAFVNPVISISTKKGICVSHLHPPTEYKCKDLAAFSEDIWWYEC